MKRINARMMLYRDADGKYKNLWSEKVLIPTEQQLAFITALEAGSSGQALNGDTRDFNIEGIGMRWAGFKRGEFVWCYDLQGPGKYEGEGE